MHDLIILYFRCESIDIKCIYSCIISLRIMLNFYNSQYQFGKYILRYAFCEEYYFLYRIVFSKAGVAEPAFYIRRYLVKAVDTEKTEAVGADFLAHLFCCMIVSKQNLF